jgi:hypothetical protein
MKTQLKLICILMITVANGCAVSGQASDWQKATNWIIYNVQGRDVSELPMDSLDQFSHHALNMDSMKTFLRSVTAISPHGAVWQGVYVTTCVLHNQKRRVDISTYGGFFYDESQQKYFEIPVNLRKEWFDYLGNFPDVETGN